MNTLCIIPCGKRKIWEKYPDVGPTCAKESYTGPFAKKCREYAEKFHPGSWVILSAKHGFLFPDDLVPGPYEVTFNRKKTNPIGVGDLRNQAHIKGLSQYELMVVLGGKHYVDIVKEIFSGKTVMAPVSGCSGLGVIMGKLKSAIKAGKSMV